MGATKPKGRPEMMGYAVYKTWTRSDFIPLWKWVFLLIFDREYCLKVKKRIERLNKAENIWSKVDKRKPSPRPPSKTNSLQRDIEIPMPKVKPPKNCDLLVIDHILTGRTYLKSQLDKLRNPRLWSYERRVLPDRYSIFSKKRIDYQSVETEGGEKYVMYNDGITICIDESVIDNHRAYNNYWTVFEIDQCH